jgi:hypothetical protein
MAVSALRASTQAEGFGFIHPAHTVIRFSFVSHWRITLALVLLAVVSICLLGECMVFATASAAFPPKPVVWRAPRRQPVSTPKQGRVWMPVLAETPKLDLIERMSDGSFARSAYFDVSLDLAEDADQAKAGPLQAYQEQPSHADPFDLVMRPSAGDTGGVAATSPKSTRVAKSARPVPVRGEPINVSIAAPLKPASKIRRLVSLPAREEPLRNIEGAVDVPEAEFASLARELGTDSVKPGEELDMLVEDTATGETQIVFARHVSPRKGERLLARLDSGHFRTTAERHLYDRLVAEAAAGEAPAAAKPAPHPQEARDLGRAASAYPKLADHLARGKVPAKVGLQVVELLKANNIRWSKSDDMPVLDVVFRKGEDGGDDLVSITLHEGETERHFYRYQSGEDGQTEFFDHEGRSVSKSLMHKPVSAGQQGDGFGWRVHPILQVKKFHNGVDFRAPKGSPIVAAGDGVVEKISWEDGYGKFVRIRHDGGYETTYAHIDGTPKDLKIGQRVTQGQVIAYVGSTGLSTGPHLYYELRVGNTYEDPTKAQMPAGTVLRGRALDEFHRQVAHVEAITQAIRTTAKSAAEAVAHVLTPDTERGPQ